MRKINLRIHRTTSYQAKRLADNYHSLQLHCYYIILFGKYTK